MVRPSSGVMGVRTGFLWGLLAACALTAFVGSRAWTRSRSGSSEPAAPTESPAPRRMTGSTPGGQRPSQRPRRRRPTQGREGQGSPQGRQGQGSPQGAKGKDRLLGGKGKDRLFGGKGADRLKAVDNRKDRAVNAGPGKDLCVIDQVDLSLLRHCEKAKVTNRRGGQVRSVPALAPVPAFASGTPAASPAAARFRPASSRSTATARTQRRHVSGGGGVGPLRAPG